MALLGFSRWTQRPLHKKIKKNKKEEEEDEEHCGKQQQQQQQNRHDAVRQELC